MSCTSVFLTIINYPYDNSTQYLLMIVFGLTKIVDIGKGQLLKVRAIKQVTDKSNSLKPFPGHVQIKFPHYYSNQNDKVFLHSHCYHI